MIAGGIASLTSTVALLAAGQRESADAAAPVNAISHWFWDRPALRQNGTSVRYTLTGYLVHHLASVFWATLHARAGASGREAHKLAPVLAGSAATAAVACLVDLRMTPERLTPGFEHRLSARSMAMVYGCFALGLAMGSMAVRRKRLRRVPEMAGQEAIVDPR